MMDLTSLKTAVKTSISDVLETMFFLPIELSEAEEPEDLASLSSPEVLAAGLSFKGHFSGSFILLVPFRTARTVTGNFLGEEDNQVGEDEISGTVQEILNMITGKSFSLFEEGAVFKLGFPEMLDPQEVLSGASGEGKTRFSILIQTLEATSVLMVSIHP